MAEILIEARKLVKHFEPRGLFLKKKSGAAVKAVDGVDLAIRSRETVGLVGESGCGKSTVGRLFLRLLEPTSGQVLHKGTDLMSLAPKELDARRRDLQIVFQDPFGSLNPRMSVGAIIAEPFAIHRIAKGAERERRVARLLDLVGLPRAAADRYPHQFSGGQRQRIGIARSLALDPEFLVCDEAVSALDVSVQAQIINLLQDLQQELGLTYLFISHNLSVVRHISDRVAVMYLGRIVELADAETLFKAPAHPYTRALLSAIPPSHPGARRHREKLKGDVPSPLAIPKGCRFAPRCRFAVERCRVDDPALSIIADGRSVACHLVADGSLSVPPRLSPNSGAAA
ncbi:MAG TPA: oligopeptide/dipeptide ABC transporter ATP-binding protein [Nordella sp.]|nr:oligopeptide/dipeptide ABC transporter ATP-binding protein [Nordella sp.]